MKALEFSAVSGVRACTLLYLGGMPPPCTASRPEWDDRGIITDQSDFPVNINEKIVITCQSGLMIHGTGYMICIGQSNYKEESDCVPGMSFIILLKLMFDNQDTNYRHFKWLFLHQIYEPNNKFVFAVWVFFS